MTSTELSYEAWEAAHKAAAAHALNGIDKLYDETVTYARHQYALHRANPTPASKTRSNDAWALVRLRDCGVDPLGEPIDPTPAGRTKWEHAFYLATGVTWTYPGDDDTPPEHAAGLHTDKPGQYGYHGDLSCNACMDDDLWADMHDYALNARRNQKATR